jgi:hypothetical protein
MHIFSLYFFEITIIMYYIDEIVFIAIILTFLETVICIVCYHEIVHSLQVLKRCTYCLENIVFVYVTLICVPFSQYLRLYLNNVILFQNGLYSAMPFIFQIISSILCGKLSGVIIKKNPSLHLITRRLFTSVSK